MTSARASVVPRASVLAHRMGMTSARASVATMALVLANKTDTLSARASVKVMVSASADPLEPTLATKWETASDWPSAVRSATASGRATAAVTVRA